MALILGNSFWGIGAVVGALGLATTHPVAFLMIRQLLAGLLLLAGASSFAISSPTTVGDDAAAKTSKPIQHLRRKLNLDSFRLHFKQHWKIFASVGLTLFGSQFGTSYRTIVHDLSRDQEHMRADTFLSPSLTLILGRFPRWYYSCWTCDM